MIAEHFFYRSLNGLRVHFYCAAWNADVV